MLYVAEENEMLCLIKIIYFCRSCTDKCRLTKKKGVGYLAVRSCARALY